MKIKELFKNKTPTLNEYLQMCGVKDVEKYLNPIDCRENPTHYINMEQAVNFLYNVISDYIGTVYTNTRVYIIQDPDVDGLCSSYITYKFLLDNNVPKHAIKMLIHTTKSHNLDDEIMAQIDYDCKYLIIPDAGSNDMEQLWELSNRGINVLIADHHQVEYELKDYPPNVTIVNSTLQELENPYLSGTGVMWKIIEEFYINGSDESYLPYVALANLSDVMNISSLENRWLNKLMEVECEVLGADYNICLSGLNKNLNNNGYLTPENVTWNITPKLNACIRDGDINIRRILFGILNAKNIDYIDQTIPMLKSVHKEQQDIVKKMFNDVIDTIDKSNNLVIGFTEKSAYTGLVANKICSELNKPTFLVYEQYGEYFGSCRSPMPIKDICIESGLFTFASGHDASFGIAFPKENLDKIIEYFNNIDIESEYTVLKSISPNSRYINRYINEFSDHDDLWGKGVDKPLWHIHIDEINTKDIQSIGASGTTIKFHYGNLDFIQFFVSKKKQEDFFKKDKISLDIIGSLCYNEWRGEKKKQMIIKKIEIGESQKKEKKLEDLF